MARSQLPATSRLPVGPASRSDVLVELLSSRVRAAVLSFLVANDNGRFSLTELARLLNLSISSVQHECYKLERLKVLKGRREGASRRYCLDHDTLFVTQLVDLVVAVLGRETLLGHALGNIQGLRGALLMMTPHAHLILIGELGLEELETVQERSARLLDVDPDTIDVAFYGTDSWREHREADSALMAHLRQARPVVIAGNGAEIWGD